MCVHTRACANRTKLSVVGVGKNVGTLHLQDIPHHCHFCSVTEHCRHPLPGKRWAQEEESLGLVFLYSGSSSWVTLPLGETEGCCLLESCPETAGSGVTAPGRTVSLSKHETSRTHLSDTWAVCVPPSRPGDKAQQGWPPGLQFHSWSCSTIGHTLAGKEKHFLIFFFFKGQEVF